MDGLFGNRQNINPFFTNETRPDDVSTTPLSSVKNGFTSEDEEDNISDVVSVPSTDVSSNSHKRNCSIQEINKSNKSVRVERKKDFSSLYLENSGVQMKLNEEKLIFEKQQKEKENEMAQRKLEKDHEMAEKKMEHEAQLHEKRIKHEREESKERTRAEIIKTLIGQGKSADDVQKYLELLQ